MKKKYIILVMVACGLIWPGIAAAQGELKKADRMFERLDYSLAIPYYLEHFKNNEMNASSAARLAACYRMNNNTKEAEKWYAKAVSLKGCDPINIWYYAEALKSNHKYAEAREQYIAYGKLDPFASAKVEAAVKACDEAIAWLSMPAPFEVVNEEGLNTESSDFGPVLIGKGMLFASDRIIKDKEYSEEEIHGWSGRPFVRLYYTEQEQVSSGQGPEPGVNKGPMPDGRDIAGSLVWKDATIMPFGINEHFHNGPAAYDGGSNRLYFTRTRKVKVNEIGKYPDPTSWSGMESKRYINRLEIWSAERKGEEWIDIKPFEWNNAENYSVGHPTISPDGKYMYFSSDMPGGHGATDIYFCKLRADGTWGEPVNAGSDINTAGRESFPVMRNDGVLFFSSDGHIGMGGLDLFSAKGSANNWNGIANLRAPFNSPKDDLGIVFTKNDTIGYFASDREGGKGLDDIYSFRPVKKTEPRPEKEPVKIVFPAVYYDFDKADIRSDAEEGLIQVVQMLLENPAIKVEVAAHCDCRGSDSYNMMLSQRRAGSAYNYLVRKGIDEGRLTVKGYGEGQPVNGCIDGIQCSESAHQQNRRTEFRIIEGIQPIQK
jgi:outer membrane protein OmpA-like peptidoglycan-associated protein/tetratricopeptide (TPR) repeat protein